MSPGTRCRVRTRGKSLKRKTTHSYVSRDGTGQLVDVAMLEVLENYLMKRTRCVSSREAFGDVKLVDVFDKNLPSSRLTVNACHASHLTSISTTPAFVRRSSQQHHLYHVASTLCLYQHSLIWAPSYLFIFS